LNNIENDIKSAQRIVIKVGTSTLTYETGKMNLKLMDTLARVLSDLRNQGKEIILVSSGAIGIAMGNAYEDVKKIIKLTTDTCENAGVAKALNKYLLS